MSSSNLNIYLNEYKNDQHNESCLTVSELTTTSTNASNINLRVKYLEEELANVQADKEFVWSLWRQLQSTSPDITGAISSVVQREKEKSEQKDKKVLEILNIKDEKINELNRLFVARQTECVDLSEKLKVLEAKLIEKEDENNYIKISLKTNDDKDQMYQQMLRLKEDKIENLNLKLNEIETENILMKQDCENSKKTIELLKTEVKQANDNYEKLLNELNEFRLTIDNSIKIENEKLKLEVKSKNEKIEKQTNEIIDLNKKLNSNTDFINQQEKMIKQLKLIQGDQQNTIKTQQANFYILENETKSLRDMYEQINVKYEECLQNEKNLIHESYLLKEELTQFKQLKLDHQAANDLIKAQKYEIDKLKLQINLQTEQLESKQIMFEEIMEKLQKYKYEKQVKITKSTKENLKRSRSVISTLSKPKMDENFPRLKRAESIDQKLRSSSLERNSEYEASLSIENTRLRKFYEKILNSKENELNVLRTSHQQRLERLLSLETENNLLREHIDILDNNDNDRERKDKFKFQKSKTNLIGYKRKDNECLWNEMKLIRSEKSQLKSENINLKEKLSLLEIQMSQKLDEIDSLKFTLNIEQKITDKLENGEKNFGEDYQLDLEIEKEKIKSLNEELKDLTQKLDQQECKLSQMNYDRIKYLNLSTTLAVENKKLYKKWFQLKKITNKSIQSEKIKRKQIEFKQKTKLSTEKQIKKEKAELISRIKKISEDYKQLKVKYEELSKCKSELESTIANLNEENIKLKRDEQQNEMKLKNLKNKNELLIIENKKKEVELKDKEKGFTKQEEQTKEDMRKKFDGKIKQLSGDLNKQIVSNRNIKIENEKLTDKVKLLEEKLNHTERDNTQKKQLIDFYKKKIEEQQNFPIVDNDIILNDYKQQMKKLNETNEKLKVELKSIREKMQIIQQEKLNYQEQYEKVNNELAILKKEKLKLEQNLKQSKTKINELDVYVDKLEQTAENNLKSLSDTSQKTLDIAQARLRFAFTTVRNYERTIKFIFKNLVSHCVEIKKDIKQEKLKKNQKKLSSTINQNCDNIKNAMNIASSVLNLTHDELDELISPVKLIDNQTSVNNTAEDRKEINNQLFEFEQHLNSSKKEKYFNNFSEINSNLDSLCNFDEINHNIINLISKKLIEIFNFEKELALLKTSEK